MTWRSATASASGDGGGRVRLRAGDRGTRCTSKERDGFRLVHYSVQGNHSHALRSPREVARAVAYVLGNFFVHLRRRGGAPGGAAPAVDAYSSAAAGAKELSAPPHTWLLRAGWRLGLAGAS